MSGLRSTLARWRGAGRPGAVPVAVWNAARTAAAAARQRADRRRLVAAAPAGADREALQRQAELAAARGRTARLTDHSVLGATRAEVEALLGLLRPVDVGVPLVRLGGDGDGGYLVPDDLDGVAACFSPGVSDVSGFEADLAARGIASYLADASVDGPAVSDPAITFEKVFVGTETRPGWTTLGDWVERVAPGEDDLLLQMDVEGGEWPVLLDASDALLSRFRVVVLELHGLHLAHLRSTLPVLDAALRRLRREFVCVHAHVNNCELPVAYAGLDVPPVVEATWLRLDRARTAARVVRLPHPLDRPNDPRMPDLGPPAAWTA